MIDHCDFTDGMLSQRRRQSCFDDVGELSSGVGIAAGDGEGIGMILSHLVVGIKAITDKCSLIAL